MIKGNKIGKKKKQLLSSLSKYYLTFVLILTIIFVVSYLILGYLLSKSTEKNNSPLFNFLNGRSNLSCIEEFEEIEKLDGYAEIIDSEGNVEKTYGVIPENKVKESYTDEELFQEISLNNKNTYNTFINVLKENNEEYRILTRIPKRKMSFEFNMLKMPYSLGKQYYHSYIKVIGGAIIVSIISIIFYSIWTTKKFKKPLEKIDKSLIAIINGNYDNKLELNGEMEFEIVRDTINFLIGKLKTSEEENKKLAESKNRMLMDLSHDIKTPITTIQGFSAALAGGMIEDEEKKENYYKTIYNKSERVAELVDELFEFVKLQENNYVVNCKRTDLSEFLRQIVVGYMEELEAKGFEVEVNIPEEEIYYCIDSKLFKRVINNLIDNAIKYNKRGTKLRIEVRDVGSYIVIEVADNGIGISNEIADKIFDPFIRGDESRKSDGGSGLGLSIAQKIIESHGGTISLINSNEKEKTIFYIKLMK